MIRQDANQIPMKYDSIDSKLDEETSTCCSWIRCLARNTLKKQKISFLNNFDLSEVIYRWLVIFWFDSKFTLSALFKTRTEMKKSLEVGTHFLKTQDIEIEEVNPNFHIQRREQDTFMILHEFGIMWQIVSEMQVV